MDIDIFDALNYLTGSSKTGARLKLCDYNTITDFKKFNDKSIDKIEEYIQIRCSVMNEEQRALYLDEDDIKDPLAFMISPGLRNRLLKAAAIISQTMNNVSFSMGLCGNFIDNGNNKSDLVNEYSNAYNCHSLPSPTIQKNISDQSSFNFTENNQMNTSTDLKRLNSLTNAHRVTKNSSTLRQINQPSSDDSTIPLFKKSLKFKMKEKSAKRSNTQTSKFKQKKFDSKISETIINNCYESIVTDHILNFENCNLIPRTDFDIEIQINEKSVGNSKCFYICCQCNNKYVKFSLNKDLKPIQTGIKSHNRTHFSTKSSFISTQLRKSLGN